MRRLLIGALLPLSVACGKADYPGPLLPPPQTSAALTSVASCDDLDERLKRHLEQQMERQVEAQFRAAFDVDCGSFWDVFRFGAAASEDYYVDAMDASAETYTTTNNQVAGVDEADIVKNDGNTIYVLSGDALAIVDAWPVAEARLIGRLPLEGSPQKLLVANQRAVVYALADTRCSYQWDDTDTTTLIHVIDLTDLTAPRLERTMRMTGSLVAARAVGPAIHTVIGSKLPRQWFATHADANACDDSAEEMRQAYLDLIDENRAAIADIDLRAELPTLVDEQFAADGTSTTTQDLFGGCASLYDPEYTDATGITTVLSFPIDQHALAFTSIIGGSQTVYATADRLYTATTGVGAWRSDWWSAMITSIHAFTLDSEGEAASYRASGFVQGTIINQFALDAYEDHLRVATTFWSDAITNNIYVLGERDGLLEVTGKVENFGLHEDIRSVRFDGATGYVVTFEKTDPLFTFDLRDPQSPRLRGELIIPGFSTYMHQLDDDHLLTIGFEGSDQGDFSWFTGLALQIFDVTDIDHPRLLHKESIGTRGTSSEATNNHLAFTFFRDRGLLAVPMAICEGGDGDGHYGDVMTFNGLLVYDVSIADGFRRVGAVDHGVSGHCSTWWQNPDSAVERSIFMDDYVYSLSSTQLVGSDTRNFATPVVDLALDGLPETLCY